MGYPGRDAVCFGVCLGNGEVLDVTCGSQARVLRKEQLHVVKFEEACCLIVWIA